MRHQGRSCITTQTVFQLTLPLQDYQQIKWDTKADPVLQHKLCSNWLYLYRIISRPNETPRQILYYNTNCVPIDLMFKENFPPNKQVNKFGIAWAIEMSADREEWSELPMGATTAAGTRSGTSVIRRTLFHHEHGSGRQPTDRNWTQLPSQRLQNYDK